MKRLVIGFLLLIGVLVSIGYLKPGLPLTDDGAHMVIRASAFHQSFKDGHLPVRWLDRLHEQYGYPVMNYLYPLPFYLAEPINLIGFSAMDSIKGLFVLSSVIAGLGMYFFLKQKVNWMSAVVGSLVYLVLPYRLENLYTRGSLGELVALSIVPWVFWQLERARTKKRLLHWVIAGSLWGALILSHNTMALLLSIVVFGYIFLGLRKKNNIKVQLIHVLVTGMIALGVSAFFWIPALSELSYTKASQVDIANTLDYFTSGWSLLSQVSLLAIVILLAVLLWLRKSKEVLFWGGVSVVSLLLQLSISWGVWQALNLDTLIQFPFRFNGLLLISVSVLAGWLFQYLLTHKKQVEGVLFSLVVAVYVASALLRSFSVIPESIDPNYFESNFGTSTTQNEFTPKDVSVIPDERPSEVYLLEKPVWSEARVVESHIKTQEKHLQIYMPDTVKVTFLTHYFPGWKVLVDDIEVEPSINQFGTMAVEIEPSERDVRDVKLVWTETPIRAFANVISLVSMLVVSLYICVRTIKPLNKALGIFALVITVVTLGITLLQTDALFELFNEREQEQRYLQSQWVDPMSEFPIGDHGLYAWAGWAYVTRGENPILINSEMPPLGKYLIGIGLVLTQRPAMVGLLFSIGMLISLFLLSKRVLGDRYLAVIPVALIVIERVFIGSLTVTMLDNLQVLFFSLALWMYIGSNRSVKRFILGSLLLGAMVSTKFYASGILAALSIGLFFTLTKQWSRLKLFLITLPLMGLVHVASYWRFFLEGNTLIDYIRVQLYIFHFYRQGTTTVPFGSYWLLVFFNQWRVWWGAQWGESYTLQSKEWSLLWPIQALGALYLFGEFIKRVVQTWRSVTTKIPDYFILVSWLLCYSVFLSAIGGWPHYMMLFLPFSSILLVMLGQTFLPKIRASLVSNQFIRRLYAK